MARAVVKFSLNTPKGRSALSNTPRANARAALEAGGVFHHAGTSNLHAEGRTQQEIFDALRSLIDQLEPLQGPVTVDHLWVYFDNEPGPEPAGEAVDDVEDAV
jgi:hypothetical protein